MRVTQGLFAFLPDLQDDEILAQIEYALAQGWSLAVEYTDDPHPRNIYWEMWGIPMFDLRDAAGVMLEVEACRRNHPDQYVRVLAFDSRKGFETVRMSFIVNRPPDEPGFELIRAEGPGRRIHYTVAGYAARRPSEGRYGEADRAPRTGGAG